MMRILFVVALLFLIGPLPAQVTYEGPITIEAGRSGNLVIRGKQKPDVLQPVNPPPAEGSCGFSTAAALPSGTVGAGYSVQLNHDANCLLPVTYAIQDLTGVTTWTSEGSTTPDFNETFSEPSPCDYVETTTGGPVDWPLKDGATVVSTGPLGSICQLSKAAGTTHVITGLGALSRLTVKGTFRRPTGGVGNVIFAMMDAAQNTLGFVRVNDSTFNLEVRSTGGTDVILQSSAVDTTYTVEFDCVQSDSAGSSFCRASINGGAWSANATGTWTAKIDGVRLGFGPASGTAWAHGPITMCHAGAFLDGFCAGGAPDQWSATSTQPNTVRLCDSSPCTPADRMDASDWSWVAGTLTIESAVDPDTRIVEITGPPFPGGLLSSTGLLSGTPTTAATYTPLVRITDALGNFSEREFSVTINAVVSGPTPDVVYYVAKTGSDSNSCTQAQSQSTPKLTIGAGIACLSASKQAVDIKAGTYVESFISNIRSGTDWDNPIWIRAFLNDDVIIRPSLGMDHAFRFANQRYIIVDGQQSDRTGLTLDCDNTDFDCVKITITNGNASDHIRLANMIVRDATIASGCVKTNSTGSNPGPCGSGLLVGNGSSFNEIINVAFINNGTTDFDHGTYFSSAQFNLVDGCLFDGNYGYGGKFDCSGTCNPESNSNILRNSILRNNNQNGYRSAWVINGGQNNEIYNNIFHENAAGIQLSGAAGNNKIYNNTLWNNNDSTQSFNKYCLRVVSSAGDFFRNNVCYQHDNGNINLVSGGTITESNNLLGTNPLFINAATGNFRVQAGSPAIDTGTTILPVTEDFDGVARPQGAAYDIGAFEQ